MANTPIHRAALVEAAMRLFRRQGYAGTGLQQILAESGAPKGSLYHYFPGGKEEVGAAAVELAGDLVADFLNEISARHESAGSFIRAYFRQYAKWMKESRFSSGCPIATTLLETAPDSQIITAAGQAAILKWTAIIAGVFKRNGYAAAASQRHAQLTIASLEGALILSRTAGSATPLGQVARALCEAHAIK